jgi:hypothetical protein
LNIDLTFDQPTNSLPAGFVASLDAVAQFYDSLFTNPITVNIDVGYGEIGNTTPPTTLGPGVLGESEAYFNQFSYSQIKSALVADATSADQVSAANSLPAADPTNGGNFWVSTAEAKALGLMGASSAIDGYVGFSNSVAFTYNTTNGGAVAAGTYDFFGVAAHEISEVLGRDLFAGSQDGQGIGPNSFTPLDLFHYSSNGVRDFSGTTAGYFSLNGGATNLDNFNTNPSGDFGDWASSVGNDAFLAFSRSGVANPVSQTDLRELNILGYGESAPVAAPGTFGVTGNFGNGQSDLLWQSASGTPTIWLMGGSTVESQVALSTPPSSWHIITTGNFGNGQSDIVWQSTDGTPLIWVMNRTTEVGAPSLGSVPSSWHLITTGNFGNGQSDLVWQNTGGTPLIWMMNGTTEVGAPSLGSVPSSWHLIATGNFGNGQADLVWQNTDGTPLIWMMNGTTEVSAPSLGSVPSSWHIVATGDFNGDGADDLLWQNTDGTPLIWIMNGAHEVSGQALSNPGANWKIVGTGDYNGDGEADIVFLNASTNQTQVWLMNGTQVSAMVVPSNDQAAPPSSNATPMSSTPVLSDIDISYADTSAAAPGAGRVSSAPSPPPNLGPPESGSLFNEQLGAGGRTNLVTPT